MPPTHQAPLLQAMETPQTLLATTSIKNITVSILVKKIALRTAYLSPFPSFFIRNCVDSENKCSDLYGAVFLYIEVQSIWPEPVLLTSAKLEQIGFKEVTSHPGSSGGLGEKITNVNDPSQYLLRPGEIKTIALSRGINLEKAVKFFDDEIKNETLFCQESFCVLPDPNLLKKFNSFLGKEIGAKSTLRLTIYEKDYQPLLTANFPLANGSDLFYRNDVKNDHFRLQHDRFIAEAICRLRSGRSNFQNINLKNCDAKSIP